jgi:DNA-binding XRE family transcriptional regulator
LFIDELRAARRGKGLTRAELAERIGVTEQTIKRLEQGTGSTATLVAAMAALDFHLNGIGRGATLFQQINARIGKLGWSPALVAKRAGLKRPTVLAVMEETASMASTLSVLAAVAPNIRRASPARVHWSPDRLGERDSRFTPPHYLNAVVDAFGEIDLDPCAHLLSPVVASDAYVTSRRERKKIEMLFAHLKRILKLDRLRLRGPNGARDEFLLAATAQNLRKMAKLLPMPGRAVAA